MKFYLTTLPGLSGVMARELNERLGISPDNVMKLSHNDITAVRANDASALFSLRTKEDLFVAVGQVPLSGQPADIKALGVSPMWRTSLQEALNVWSKANNKTLVKRLVWRVVVQADDAAWRQYRRQELTLTAEAAIMRTGSWRINRDEAPLELWLWQAGRELIVALRITNNADRQHGGRPEERAVALRPSAAAAMVLLTRPEPDDVFLDPMCGSGTLLLERAQMGRYQLLLGGDSDPAAVETTLANFGPRHQPRRIERWDARHLPLEDGSVNKIACNLPWGRQVGEKGDMPALYRDFLAEAARVLSPVGRMALLTGEWSALKTALGARSELILDETVRDISILGRRADLFVITRR